MTPFPNCPSHADRPKWRTERTITQPSTSRTASPQLTLPSHLSRLEVPNTRKRTETSTQRKNMAQLPTPVDAQSGQNSHHSRTHGMLQETEHASQRRRVLADQPDKTELTTAQTGWWGEYSPYRPTRQSPKSNENKQSRDHVGARRGSIVNQPSPRGFRIHRRCPWTRWSKPNVNHKV